ncbi:MAG: IS3 family transposase [Deltaproteobacteria bacterium]|nr:IS3 family transposase [Deltaproteobacteria bacterium]
MHTWLNRREGCKIGKNRVLRIMRENDLLIPQKRYNAKRNVATSKPKAEYPNQYWGIDMTKFLAGCSWFYLVIVIDWYTKKIVGWDLALRSKGCD